MTLHTRITIDGRDLVVYRDRNGKPYEVAQYRAVRRMNVPCRHLVQIWGPHNGEPKGLAAQAIKASTIGPHGLYGAR
jgi:hypothetical protein